MGHVFCRKALNRISHKMVGVNQSAFTVGEVSRQGYTIEGPNGFTWQGQACCEWYAKEQALLAYMAESESEDEETQGE